MFCHSTQAVACVQGVRGLWAHSGKLLLQFGCCSANDYLKMQVLFGVVLAGVHKDI